MLRMVIFDFDGVITDSEAAHYQAMSEVAGEEGIQLSWQEYCEKYIAYDDREFYINLWRDNHRRADPQTIDALVERKKRIFMKFLEEHCGLLPGISELLENLRQSNIPCGICSGSSRHEIDFLLKRHELEDYFMVIIGADDVTASKPDPQGYLMCLEQANQLLKSEPAIKPGNCVVIEDSVGGVQSAKTAGMHCLAVTNSHHADQLGHADKIVESLQGVDSQILEQMLD